MKKLEKKQIVILIFVFALLLLVGGTYAYFSINATSDKTGAKVTGKANNLGNPTMQTKTSKLYLNLDASLMSQANAGKTYYANENESGLALETNPNYTLATASLPEGDEALDCTYNYKVTATVTTPITDNSDSDVKVIVGDKTMTLKELTTAGTTGIIVSGEIKNLTKGQSVSIPLTSSVTNTATTQDKLVGNSYTINIEPYTSGDKKVFSCKLHADSTPLADYLIASGDLWQSGLEGDGYRYAGKGVTCSYDSGNYIGVANNQSTAPTCPVLYKVTSTVISSGDSYDYYNTSCPSDNSSYTYSCTKLNAVPDKSNVPNNFICFGTTDASECTSNQDKYMYRVIGVFEDANGNNHAKLIKFKQLGIYTWESDYYNKGYNDISWENSDMYEGLNGDYFLTNTKYDYLQNATWLNKVTNWTWSAVNTKTASDSGPDYMYELTSSQIYLHEMNRSTKSSTIGEWTNPVAKIGLMYVSDYSLSLGSSTLQLTPSPNLNDSLLKTGWMHQSNNDTTASSREWTMSRFGAGSSYFFAWGIYPEGRIDSGSDYGNHVDRANAVRPTFYLTSDTKVSGGDGSLENPFITEE